MNFAHLILMLGMAALAGCCCGGERLSPVGGFCSLGTYGSACTDMCNRVGGGADCFSQCTAEVSAQGLGDATTCCSTTYRQECQIMCGEYGSYGMDECMNDCAVQYEGLGFSMDECALPV
ncbi:MAG: hypothetical protein WC350_00905 [Candidatus Micrarchaeia archaeon]